MDTLFSCFTQFITTTLSILASVFIAYWTFRSQSKKDAASEHRLQELHKESSLELFQAVISQLILFTPRPSNDFCRDSLLLSCQKIELIENQLSSFDHTELPDYFIKGFLFYRTRISLVRLSAEHFLKALPGPRVPDTILEDLDIDELTNKLENFVAEYLKDPESC